MFLTVAQGCCKDRWELESDLNFLKENGCRNPGDTEREIFLQVFVILLVICTGMSTVGGCHMK